MPARFAESCSSSVPGGTRQIAQLSRPAIQDGQFRPANLQHGSTEISDSCLAKILSVILNRETVLIISGINNAMRY